MKSVILSIVLSITALSAVASPSDDRDTAIGFCGAFHLIKKEHARVQYIASLARNKAIMQAAANHYVNTFSKDIPKSLTVAKNACESIGVQMP